MSFLGFLDGLGGPHVRDGVIHLVVVLASVHALAAVTAIHVPHIRYLAILPEIVMLGGAVLLLGVASLSDRPVRMSVTTVGTVVISGASMGLAWWQWADVRQHGPFTTVAGAVVTDGFSALIAILASTAMLLTALVGDGYLRREGVEGPEFHVLAMVSASGAMIMGQANDLIVIFLGLEIMSIALYVLAALNPRRATSGEAALKYFVLGSFSSAIFVYGIALTYGATGGTNLAHLTSYLSTHALSSNGVLLAGMGLLLVGFGFKVAAVPFHMWTPDVYQGAPSPVTGFMAAIAKAGGFAALLRVFVSSFGTLRPDWRPIVYVIAIVTLVVGAGLAVVQRDVKRMLAYSSINHAGFVLLGLQAADARGVSAALYYVFTYSFMVIGSFAVVTLLGRSGDVGHDIAGYRALARRQPVLALAFAVLLLAQAGVPFTTGFLAKLQVVAAVVDAHSAPLGFVAMGSAAIAAFFYLRVAVLMYTPRRPRWVPPGREIVFDPIVGPQASTAAREGSGVSGQAEPEIAPGGSLDGGTAEGAVATVPRTLAELRLWSGSERTVAVVERLNADLLIDREAEAVEDGAGGRRVRVPPAAIVAIGICIAVTVVFGIVPGPLVDFTHHSTLLLLR